MKREVYRSWRRRCRPLVALRPSLTTVRGEVDVHLCPVRDGFLSSRSLCSGESHLGR